MIPLIVCIILSNSPGLLKLSFLVYKVTVVILTSATLRLGHVGAVNLLGTLEEAQVTMSLQKLEEHGWE